MSKTSLFRRNVGGLDRGMRLSLGAALVAAGLLAGATRGDPMGIILAVVGAVGVLTGTTGRCPLYVPLGFSTAEACDEPSKLPEGGPSVASRG